MKINSNYQIFLQLFIMFRLKVNTLEWYAARVFLNSFAHAKIKLVRQICTVATLCKTSSSVLSSVIFYPNIEICLPVVDSSVNKIVRINNDMKIHLSLILCVFLLFILAYLLGHTSYVLHMAVLVLFTC